MTINKERLEQEIELLEKHLEHLNKIAGGEDKTGSPELDEAREELKKSIKKYKGLLDS